MPSLPFGATLLDSAGTALKASRGSSTPAPSPAADDPAAAAPFAQTLRQSVQSQRQANGPAPAQNGAPSGTGTASSPPGQSSPANPAGPSGSTTSNASDGSKPADKDDPAQTAQPPSDAAAAAQAAALAAAASVQAQLQARPDAVAQTAGDTAASTVANAAQALAGHPAQADGTSTSGSAPQSVRDALQTALDTLTGGGQAAAAPTIAQNTGGNAAADNAPPRTPLATKGLTLDKTLAAAPTQADPAPPTIGAAAGSVKADASGALAALQDSADAARATLASASAALQQNVPTSQAAGASIAGTATAQSLAPMVGTPDWTDALSQKVVFLSNAHQQSAELTLNPPDLGPLQVVLRIADNHAHALFVSQHAQVRDAVEAALPKLRDAMESGGLGLGSASVSDGGFGAAQQQTPQQHGGHAHHRRAFGAPAAGDGLADAAPSASTATQRVVGLVDTFA
ncbi:flagellar hook-length control protein FliK [Burkholderia alba]|uniref:flagellar hook-length control protein FliK n=1 Tax=Burkholderia alba TaxID=2683677 RepID=UPI002B05B549|nr:flagellar hook-length control protein FliK [Burkholderia alba]